ncbi:MAG: OmpA family protein [Pseudomonadota bacterium]
MKSRVWMNIVMAVLVSGLFLTVSCAKKTVVSDATTIEDQTKSDAKVKAEAEAKAEADRLMQQKIDEQMAKEQAMKTAIAKAKADFLNQDVLFAYDSSDLDATAVMLLKEKAAWLQVNASASATIEGHCDERGTTEYNLALGERRASVVKAYLVNLGIAGSRLNIISYGEEKPLSVGNTEDVYRLNRRAHFAID